jgi:ABC-type branched-subunit amino acid transport system ATPase component
VLLETKDLSRSFGQKVAVEAVTLQIPEGEAVALIGKFPGSGCSTLINLLAGHLRPDSGVILFDNQYVTSLIPSQRAEKGLVCSFHETNLFDELTIADHVLAVARNSAPTVNELYSQWRSDSQYLKKAIITLAEVGLHIPMDTRVCDLSAVQKKILGLGLATLNPVRMVLWENPVRDIELSEIKDIVFVIHELKRKGVTILFTSSNAQLIGEVADRELLMESGRIVANKPR